MPQQSVWPLIPVLSPIKLWLWAKKECIRDFPDHLSGMKCALSSQEFGGDADDNDSFVDIMSGTTADGGAESEGSTFAEALARANLSVETLAEGVFDTSQLPTS